MKEKAKFDKDLLLSRAQGLFEAGGRYSMTIFLLLVAVVYGFVFYQITTLDSRQPTQPQIDKFVRASHAPHIDRKMVKQLESLKDNSVNVQTLFEQARENPFQ